MKVGVYVDAFNLYFGGRFLCGRNSAGWRWLDIRSLATDLVNRRHDWSPSLLTRVVYCTALIDGAANPGGRRRQDTYIRALKQSGAIDHVEFGHYVHRVKKAPLATEGAKRKPIIQTAQWPVMVKNASGQDTPGATFVVSYAYREEKGSDVNVAAHLLVDIHRHDIEAAVVVSNDSDLRYPIQEARKLIPVGTVNPTKNPLAGDLRGQQTDGVGRHWWYQLTAADFHNHQLPSPTAGVTRPQGW